VCGDHPTAMNIYLDEGVAAIQQRDFKKASYLLAQAVKREPENVMAWLWLAKSLPDPERRRRCIERALVVDPQHGAARRMLMLHDRRFGSTNGALAGANGSVEVDAAPYPDDDPEISDMLESADAPIIELPRPSRPRSMGKLLAEVGLDTSKQARRALEVLIYLGLAAFLLLAIVTFSLPLGLRLLAGLAALIFLVYGVHHLARLVQDRGRPFKLYQFGIEQNHPHRRWLWYDFTRLRQVNWQLRLPLPGQPLILLDVYGLMLQSEGDKTWLLSRTFEDCRDIGEIIMARTEAMWVERDYEAILRGEVCRYRQTLVDETGIRRGTIELTWDDVDEVDLRGERIWIRAADGRTIRERFRGTWNAHILIGLVERMIESRL